MARDPALLTAIATEVLRRNAGLAPLRAFGAAGLTGPDMGRLRHLGVVERPRIGWYLDPAAPPVAVEAVRVGGLLACVSAAESYGMFVPEGLDGRTHVSLPPDSTRLRRSDDPGRHVHAGRDPRVRLHWEQRVEPPRGWRVSPADALLQMAHCTSVRWLTAAVDSARNSTGGPPILSASSTTVLREALPANQVAAVDRSDPLAESVGETFIRLEAQDRHLPWRSQAWLTTLYRSDGLVDEWLPIESDGIKHHSGKAVVRDRERDAVIAYFGHPPLRFAHTVAVRETAYVGDVIEQVWRRGR
jgi:very-short-patch-repair endonuclease